MHWSLNSWANDTHLCNNSINCNELVDKISLQPSGCHMISSEVAIEIHIVNLNFLWELILCGHLFTVSPSLAPGRIVLHTFDCLVELVLEHLNCSERVSSHELWKSWVELSELVHIYSESVRSPNYSPYFLLTFLVIEEILNHFLQLEFFCIRADETSRRGHSCVCWSIDHHFICYRKF